MKHDFNRRLVKFKKSTRTQQLSMIWGWLNPTDPQIEKLTCRQFNHLINELKVKGIDNESKM